MTPGAGGRSVNRLWAGRAGEGRGQGDGEESRSMQMLLLTRNKRQTDVSSKNKGRSLRLEAAVVLQLLASHRELFHEDLDKK